MTKKQSDPKKWQVTMRGEWFEGGSKTVVVEAANNMDAKVKMCKDEFGGMLFTSLFKQMTAKLVSAG